MKRNQFSAIFATVIVLAAVGAADIATAQSSQNKRTAIERVCNPDSFERIRQTDFRGINLSRRQQRTVQNAYQSFLTWVTDNVAVNKCFENGTVTQPFLTKYTDYEVAVRKTLNKRQLEQWDRNVNAILRSR